MEWGNAITYLAETQVKGQPVAFGIKDADRTAHLAVVGKSGSGKPSLVATMALQDIARGMGVLVLDSVGSVVQTLLERVPKEARERLIVLDPSDGEYPYSWNAIDDFRALAETEPEEAHERLSEALASVYQCENGALTEFAASYVLSHAEATLLTLYTLVSDPRAKDRMLRPKTPEREKFELLLQESPDAVAAIHENGKYLAKDTLARNVLGQKESKFSLKILEAGLPAEAGGIVVVDLSRVRMFPTRITPLVRLFVAAARLHGREDAPLGIYLHDCLRYLSPEDFDKALLDRTVAFTFSDTSHGEEEKVLREKALQRAGSVIAFSPHEMDFPVVERVFYPYVPPEELQKLSEGECVVALSIDAVRSRPFFGKTLPLPERSGISPRDLELESRSKYTIPRLKADDIFRPRIEDEERGGRPADPGSFSDTFRSIFTKRAGAPGGSASAPAVTAKSSSPFPQRPPAQPKPADTKAPGVPTNQNTAPLSAVPAKNDSPQKMAEISEDELKKMFHVGKIPQ